MNFANRLPATALLAALLLAMATPANSASEPPPPPDSPLSRMVRKLTESKALKGVPAKPKKEDLLLPEFHFQRAKDWLLFPELAKGLSSNEVERKAVHELLVQGAAGISELLAKEGADNDVAVATALLMTQLWGFVHDQEVPEAATDALHAQIVAAIKGPEMKAMSDADKQRYWEYCIGFPVFVLGMKEVVTEASAITDLKTIASAGFAAVIGVRPELLVINESGLRVAEGVLAAASQAPPSPTPPAAQVNAIVFDPPAGWSREDANWATIFRSTLVDVDDAGKPSPNSRRQHAGAIFVLPPRPAPQGGGKLFDEVWREQFSAFELGDSFVHYRARLKCGLVIHYMGRWFKRLGNQNEANQTYGVLYLVDLGDRVQPITATVVPGSEQYSMSTFNESAGLGALIWPLEAMLNSIRPASGAAPYPRGGYFTPDDFYGDWSKSSSSFGGFYVSAVTGQSAGAAMTAASNWLLLNRDGTFKYKFGGYVTQPGMGTTISTDDNDGSFVLDGDIVRFTPRVERSYKYDKCAVGIGRVTTPDGPKRILALVGSNMRGEFIAPQLVPIGDTYQGVLDWYIEK